jgi:F0F1-type ATP synthase assembly protein I
VKDRQQVKESQAGQNRGKGAVYQGAFEAVIALLIAICFGYWLDGYFDTAPWLLLVGAAIGFASFTVRLMRLGRWMKDESSGDSAGTDESE